MIQETLLEFLADGAPYQLVTKRDGWIEIWRRKIDIDGLAVIEIIGGVDTSAPQSPTSVVDVLISSGALTPEGDEVGKERFIIYHKDFTNVADAEADVRAYRSTVKMRG